MESCFCPTAGKARLGPWLFAAWLVGFVGLELVGAQSPWLSRIPDTSSVRQQSWSAILDGPTLPLGVYRGPGAQGPVTWEVVRQADREGRWSRYLVLSPPGASVAALGQPGQFVFKWDEATQAALQTKIFLAPSASRPGLERRLGGTWGTYLVLRPEGRRSRADFAWEGVLLVQNLPLALDWSAASRMSLEELRAATRGNLPWDMLLGQPTAADRRLRLLAEDLNRLLTAAGLQEVEDGAQDALGRWVHIATGQAQTGPGGFNCSGFVKWLTDGLIGPQNGLWLGLEGLKEKNEDERGHNWTRRFEEARDPWFGLDWTRNLARAVAQAQQPGRSFKATDFDVPSTPFVTSYRNRGFALENLEAVLAWLAAVRPGRVYLGSFNAEMGDPLLNQHHHVSAFLPYLNEQGLAQIRVFDIDGESSLDSLRRRFPGRHVHLVELSVPERWQFPALR